MKPGMDQTPEDIDELREFYPDADLYPGVRVHLIHSQDVEHEAERVATDGGLVDTTSMGWRVEEATARHREAIEALWTRRFDDASAACHQATLDECLDPDHDFYPYSQAYVATDGRDRVVGFGIVAIRNTRALSDHTTLPEAEFTGRDGYLYLSCVNKAWTRRGIGTELFRRRLAWCQRHDANRVYGVAWQNPEGPTSDPLFQQFGFDKIGPTPDDYYQGRDCTVCPDACTCTGVIYRLNFDDVARVEAGAAGGDESR